MSYTNPDSAQFTAFFNQDFPYTLEGDQTGVRPSDITKALIQQQNLINPCLFNNQNLFTQGALLLAAHFLVGNLRASSQGVAGKFDWLTSSKAVGSVSTSLSIPDRLLENPELAMLVSTTYGTQFVFMILPVLTGNMFAVAGGTVGPVNGIFSGPYGQVGPWGSR